MEKKYYSTSEIAEILEVNRYTVSLWIDQGEMKAMVTPGGHKKVSREELISFIKTRGGTLPTELEPPKRKKVFIIDDESDVARFYSKCIHLVYPEIVSETFTHPVPGLLEIGKSAPDMVILDIVMPDMDGISVCGKIREQKETENVKIVAVSGKYDKATVQRVKEAGADDFYYKLSPIDELMRTISKHLGVSPDEEKMKKLAKIQSM